MLQSTRFAAVLVALFLAACSSGGGSADPDASVGSDADAGVDAAVDCAELQRQYVNGVIAPEEQTSVEATVGAVLRAADFPAAMPYCSGPRPE